ELPAPFRSRISSDVPADWAGTTYPTDEDLATSRRDAAELEAARGHLASLRKQAMQAASVSEQLARLRQQRDRLAAEIAEEPAKDLRHARAEINALRPRRADLDRESDAIPPEARRPADELREAVQVARRAAADCDERLGEVQRLKGTLETRQKQRAELEA